MIKPISTSPIRKAALALIVTAPIIAGSCKSRQQANESNIITESVTLTSEQAEAVKNVALVQVVQDDSNDKPIYSNEKNTKLEKKLLATASDEEDQKYIKDFIEIANKAGLFGATIQLQRFYDNDCLINAMDEYMIYHKKRDAVDAEIDKIVDWQTDYLDNTNKKLLDMSYNKLNGLLSAQECSKYCDDFIKSNPLINDADIQEYNSSVKAFENMLSRQAKQTPEEQMSKLIAYKTYTADRIIYKKIIAQHPIFKDNLKKGRYNNFNDCFNLLFVEIAKPSLTQ